MRRLIRKAQPATALILTYHRVAEPGLDSWGLCVTPQHFREHLEVLKKNRRVMQLKHFTCDFLSGNLQHGTVVITFDDGYADNLINAKPLLEEHDACATAFFVSGQIGKEREFWWDELEWILLRPGTLPEFLNLTVGEDAIKASLRKWSHYTESDSDKYRHWRMWLRPPTARHALYKKLWNRMQSLGENERQRVIDALSAWACIPRSVRPTHRTITTHELSLLEKGNLIEVGAHTLNHVLLPELPKSIQRGEVEDSKLQLEDLIGHKVDSFAYPYGEHSKDTLSIVRQAGFTSACTTEMKPVSSHNDVYRLPRISVQDWNGDQFSRFLSKWLDGSALS